MTRDEKIIAMVAMKEPARIDQDGVVARAKLLFPWFAAHLGAPSAQPGQADIFVIPVDDAIVPVMPMPFPIPREAIARAASKSWLWPQAAPALEAAGAHVIVSSLQADNEPRLKCDEAWRVTCIAAALADLPGSVGVYWATADLVLPAALFVDLAKEAGPEHAPFDLWVATDFYPGPNHAQDKTIIARTNGLDLFMGREIECGPIAAEPGAIGPIVRGVGQYVFDQDIVFQGGETIGTDANPIGRIRLDRTAVGVDSKDVYRVLLAEERHA